MPWPNTTKEEIEEYDRELKENVAKYYEDRFWGTLSRHILEEKEKRRRKKGR